MRFRFSCPMRWGDMDAFGHVNNVSYLSYLEEARTAMLFSGEAADRMPTLLEGVVVARHEISYLRPLRWHPEPIDIDVWVSELRAASFALGYDLCDGDVTVATASTVLVPYDLAGQRPRRLTNAETAYLGRFTDGAGATSADPRP